MRLARAEALLLQLNRLAIVVLFGLMFAFVFVNVVTRYLLHLSIPWAEEVSAYLLVWMAYLGAGLAMREGRHVAVTAVERGLPPSVARYVRVGVGAAILAFLGVLGYVGVRYARFAWQQKTPILRAPLGAVYLAIPVGAMVFLLHLVSVFADHVEGRLGQAAAPQGASGDAEGEGGC